MDTLGIVPKWLPTYSPNLNLIERAWGFTKRELRKVSYLDYESFRSKIDEILSSTTGANKEKFATLIGGKIQLFDGYTCVDEQTMSSPDRRKGSRSPAA